MPENMPNPSMLPAPNRFQYAPSFVGTYQHLFVWHLLCPADFQHTSRHRSDFRHYFNFVSCFANYVPLDSFRLATARLWVSLLAVTEQVAHTPVSPSLSSII